MSVKLERWMLALSLCAALSGCKKSAAESNSPSADMAGDGMAQQDPLAQLHALEGRMRELGLPSAGSERESVPGADPGASRAGEGGGGSVDALAGEMADDEAPSFTEEAPEPSMAPTEAKASSTNEPTRDRQASFCDELRGLSESICELEVRICELAEAHGNDPIYADACERAIDDCEVSTQASEGCED